MSLLRPLKIKTTSLFRPVFASPKWYFPYDIIFDIKTTSLIRPLLGSPNSGLNIGILGIDFTLKASRARFRILSETKWPATVELQWLEKAWTITITSSQR